MNAGLSFGELLRRHRVAASLTQEALAERAGIGASSIASLERGRRTAPRPDTVALLADALNLGPDDREKFIAAAAGSRDAGTGGDAATPRTVTEVTSGADTSQAAGAQIASLPTPLTMLIGREQEESALVDLINQGSRLITITGPGGVGKTRLAVQVALDLQATYRDGAAFVDLSPVRDPALVASALVLALGLPESGSQQGRDLLVHQLQGKHLLLVLDNLEQVLAAAPLIGDLVESCAALTVLATSRAPLRLRGEQQFALAPLLVPDADLSQIQDLDLNPAVQLFVARAQSVYIGFRLSPDNVETVAQICRALDGLPLAIELAAARVRLLPPEALLARLSRPLAVASLGSVDLPDRQKTLRDTIAWSYDLLDQSDQWLLRQLSVFAGGFSLPAAEALCSEVSAFTWDVLDGIASLVDNNLLRAIETGDVEPRFGMLETIREYALEQAEAHSEIAAARQRHAMYFLNLAEQADPHLRSGKRETWLRRLYHDSDNLHAALRWCETETLDTEMGLRLAAALTWFWRFYEWFQEGRYWLETMLNRAGEAGDSLNRAKALYGVGLLAWYQGDPETAESRTEMSVALFRRLDAIEWLANAQRLLGLIRMGRGDPAGARPILEESRRLFHEVGDAWGEAMSLYRLGLVAIQLHDAEPLTYYEQSLALFQQVGDRLGLSVVLNAMGVAAAAAGDDATALSILQQTLPMAREVTDRWDLGRLLLNAATLWLRQGDERQAQALFAESLRLWQQIDHLGGIALSLAGLAGVAAARGEAERAGRLFGAAQRYVPSTEPFAGGSSMGDLDARVAEARSTLNNNLFTLGWTMGSALSLDQVIEEALAG